MGYETSDWLKYLINHKDIHNKYYKNQEMIKIGPKTISTSFKTKVTPMDEMCIRFNSNIILMYLVLEIHFSTL